MISDDDDDLPPLLSSEYGLTDTTSQKAEKTQDWSGPGGGEAPRQLSALCTRPLTDFDESWRALMDFWS